MRFLADENVESAITAGLRKAGFDVSVPPLAAGLADDAVLELSNREARILVTNDKDFAELTFLQRLASTGIVLLRMPLASADEKNRRLLEVLAIEGERLVGVFTVVEPTAIRRRPFLRSS